MSGAKQPSRSIPTISVKMRCVWRCVPVAFVDTALESGPSFTKDRRYSVQGEFGAVYLSGSRDLSQRETDQRGGDAAEPVSCLAFELTIDKLVDLTSQKTRDYFRVQLEDLVRSRIAKDRYQVTQAVARQVYTHRLSGILAPSIHDPHRQNPDWYNVILYPANLLKICLRPIDEKA